MFADTLLCHQKCIAVMQILSTVCHINPEIGSSVLLNDCMPRIYHKYLALWGIRKTPSHFKSFLHTSSIQENTELELWCCNGVVYLVCFGEFLLFWVLSKVIVLLLSLQEWCCNFLLPCEWQKHKASWHQRLCFIRKERGKIKQLHMAIWTFSNIMEVKESKFCSIYREFNCIFMQML